MKYATSSARAKRIVIQGLFFLITALAALGAQAYVYGPPYSYNSPFGSRGGFTSVGEAVQAFIADVDAFCNSPVGDCQPRTYTVQYSDSGTAATVYQNGQWATYIWATDVTGVGFQPKNTGGCRTQCTGGNGSSQDSSGPPGSSGNGTLKLANDGLGTTLEGDPINASTGNEYRQDTDIESSHWLTFRRFYNSSSFVTPTHMGPKWRSSFDRSIQVMPGGNTTDGLIYAMRADGSVVRFTGAAGTWKADADSADILTPTVDPVTATFTGFTLKVAATQDTEHYDASGYLTSIVDANGQTTTLQYGQPPYLPPGLPTAIIDPHGRILHLAYDGTGRLAQAIGPSGHTVLYYYNSAGQLWRVFHSDGNSTQYLYAEPGYAAAPGTYPGELTGVIDEKGVRYESTSFNDTNHAISTEFAGGAGKISLDYYNFYQNGGTPAQMTTPLGLVVTLGYADDGSATIKPSGVSAPCGNQCSQPWKSVTYDSNGYPATSTDFNGGVTKTTFDANGLLTQTVEAFGTPKQRTINTTWDTVHRQPLTRTVTDDATRTVVAKNSWGYNSRGQLIGECQQDQFSYDTYACGSQANAIPGFRQIRYTYCDAVDSTQCPLVGLLLSADGPSTGTIDVYQYAYYMSTDERDCKFLVGACHKIGDLASITAPRGLVTSFLTYDLDGRVVRSKDFNGVITDTSYTKRGWLATRTVRANADGTPSAGDAITTLTYDKTGALETLTDPDGVKLTFSYDDAHRLVDVADARGEHIHYTLDASGNRIREETFDAANVLRRSLSRKFNTLGQLVSVTDGLGKVVFDATALGSYDSNGNLIQAKDASGAVRKDSYDVLNHLVSTIANANGGDAATKATTMTFAFDALDQLASVTDPDGLVTKYHLDAYRNPASVETSSGITAGGFDIAGNMIWHSTAAGQMTMSYDALYRKFSRTVSAGGIQFSYGYYYEQPDTITGCKGSYPNGRRTRVWETKVGTDTFYCYDNQGRITEMRRKHAGVTDTTDYVYSLAGRLLAVASPSGTVTAYGRDSVGQIATVTVTPPNGVASPVVTAATYMPFGPIASYTLGNGQTVTRTYDANYQVTDVTSPTLNLHFARDAAGNIVALGDTAGAVPATETYQYDPLYRLTSVDDPDGHAIEAYTYTRTGDRLSKAAPGLATGTYGYQSGTQWLTSIGTDTRSYNAIGSTTGITAAGASWTFGYNAMDFLGTVEQGGSTVATYSYDDEGQRIAKTVGSSTQRFAYGLDGELLGEYGTSQRDYIWLDDLPVGVVDQGEAASITYVQADHLGAPRVVSDGTGSTLWSWPLKSNPFGEAAPVSATGYVLNLRYPGQYFDAESGLIYNRHRYYDATTGRYIQRDPVGLIGGPDMYAYVGSNPMMYSDPLGLYVGVDDAIFTGGGALVGLLGQGVSDLISGHLSGWEDYAGAAVGGAAGGEALLYTGPIGAGLAGGAATNATKQLLKNLSGKQCGYNVTSFAADTAVGGLTGLIPGARIAGVTAGRGSWNAIFRQMTTKLTNGTISSLTTKTALKMAGGRAVDTAVIPGMGAGAVAGNYLEPYIPGYADACGCSN